MDARAVLVAVLLVTACDGLHTQPNDLGEIPPGACAVAENIQISRDGMAECRRGFEEAVTPAGEADPITHLAAHDGTVMAWTSSALFQSDAGVTTLTSVGATANATVPMRSASIQDKFLYLTDGGVKAWEAGRANADTGVLPPGLPKLTPITGGTMQATDTQLAYRVVRVRKPATVNRTMTSEPSGRVTIANSTGSNQDVAVAVFGTTYGADETLQFYRSVQSVGSDVDPGDELGLVYERATLPNFLARTTATLDRTAGGVVTVLLTAAHDYSPGDVVYGPVNPGSYVLGNHVILSTPTTTSFTYNDGGGLIASAGVTATYTAVGVGFIDNVTDALVGASLYTNASQEGILQQNTQPPMVLGDVAEFRRCAFYGYARERQAFKFRVVGMGAPYGIEVGTDIDVSSVDVSAFVTGAASESSNTFQVFTAGTVAENIANTAQSIARVITVNSLGSLTAYYTSGPTDVPGQITIVANDPSVGSFNFTTSRTKSVITFGKWYSEATTFKGRIYYSKVDQPEAVPALNFFDVGGSDAEVLRLIPLRDALIVLKTDGIFRITGDGPWNFRVDPFDLTVKCLAPYTAATIENTVMVLTDQGVARISDTGVVVISRPIEDRILPYLVSAMLPTLNQYAFGVGYDSARKYLLWLPYLPASTSGNLAYVYDLFTETWVQWSVDARHAIVNPADDKLYLATGTDIWRERKTYTAADLTEPSIFTSIGMYLEWTPKFGDRPDMLHHFREVGLLVGQAGWTTSGQIGFATDLEPNMEFVTLPAGQDDQLVRVLVPRTMQRGSRLRVQFRQDQVNAATQIKGLRVVYETTGERVRR